MEAFRKKAIQAIRSRFYKCPKKPRENKRSQFQKNVTSEASYISDDIKENYLGKNG